MNEAYEVEGRSFTQLEYAVAFAFRLSQEQGREIEIRRPGLKITVLDTGEPDAAD